MDKSLLIMGAALSLSAAGAFGILHVNKPEPKPKISKQDLERRKKTAKKKQAKKDRIRNRKR